ERLKLERLKIDGCPSSIERHAAAAGFKLCGWRLCAILAADKHQPRRAALIDWTIYLFVSEVAHDDSALSRFVSPLDSNPSLVLVELHRGEILAAVGKAFVASSYSEQIAMELEHVLMAWLFRLMPIELRALKCLHRLGIEKPFIKKSF